MAAHDRIFHRTALLTAGVAPSPARRIRWINAALRNAWDKGWAQVPSLEPDALIGKAAGIAGIRPDADRVGWRSRLDLLCADLHDRAGLSDLGRTIAHGQLVSALAGRFRAHALWARRPEIADRPITAPIVIVGQMRSGTTRMQRLLACDPRFTFTRFYESWNPIPAAAPGAGPDARKLKGWLGLACARALNPMFGRIHPTGWAAPDEEIGLHNLSVFGSAFEAQWHVPGYTAAVEGDDGVAVYGEFRRLLQTLAWARGDRTDRPWVLKVPQFSQDLPALLHAFPDARLVFLSRDEDRVVSSAASLVCNQMSLQADAVDPHRIGREWRRKVRLRAGRMAAARARLSAPHVEIAYDDVGRDWAAEMRRVYAMLRLPLTPAVAARMAGYLRASRSHAGHRYDARQFGLAPALG